MSAGSARSAADITTAAAEWHALHREGELDAAQQAQFLAWLVASPEHLREYLLIGRLAGELGELLRTAPEYALPTTAHDAARNRDNVVALPLRRLRARPTPSAPPRASGKRRALPRLAMAAALLLCVGIVGRLGWPQTAHYVAAHGQPRTIALPDGTVAHLNAQSALSTRFSLFGRRVELERGQASFVVADDRRPFSVHAAGLQVQDIGTTFDVSLQREQARIGVAEGRVRVIGEGGEGRLLADLRAGQSARIDYRDQAVRVGEEDADMLVAWWQRRIVFRDEPLRDVADQFNRLNDRQLHVDGQAGALRMTGNLRGDDLDSLRVFLEQQPALVTRVAADGIHVSARAQGATVR